MDLHEHDHDAQQFVQQVLDSAALGREDPLVKEACEWMVTHATEHAEESKLSEGAFEKICQMSKLQFTAVDPRKFTQTIQCLGHMTYRKLVLKEQLADSVHANLKMAKQITELKGNVETLEKRCVRLEDSSDAATSGRNDIAAQFKQLAKDYDVIRRTNADLRSQIREGTNKRLRSE